MSKKGFPDDYIQNNPIRYNTALPPIFHLTVVVYVYCLPTYSILVSQSSANNSESLQIVFPRPTGCSPTRTRSARVRCFRLFAFTSSPFGDKKTVVQRVECEGFTRFTFTGEGKKTYETSPTSCKLSMS